MSSGHQELRAPHGRYDPQGRLCRTEDIKITQRSLPRGSDFYFLALFALGNAIAFQRKASNMIKMRP
jgi:hypothetical protein